MKLAKRISTTCTAVAAIVLLGGTAAHANGDGGLLGLGLLNTPSITLACFPAGQVGQGNSFTGTQNINCSQSAAATGTTPPSSGNGLTGYESVSATGTVGPGERAEADAFCPEGKTVTGGGFSGEFGSHWEVLSSQSVHRPQVPGSPAISGWGATAYNTGSGPQTFYVEAICYDLAS